MRYFNLAAVGRDKPGIVSEVTACLVEHDVNIADSEMSILCGYFNLVLILTASDLVDQKKLYADLLETSKELGLGMITLNEVEEISDIADHNASHLITVYGVDHPGIVHSVSSLLALRQVNITDLETRLIEVQDPPVYVMLLEVQIPSSLLFESLELDLLKVGSEEKVDITIQTIEREVL